MGHDMGSDTREFNPILRTKLHRPQLTSDLVNRDRLITAMNKAHEVPHTLVSAPAGYGKSVLVSQWAEQIDHPVAWLSLDADDSELKTFVEYFLAAVDTVSPGTCDTTGELVAASPMCQVPVLASYLLNDLHTIGAPSAIVLDDYHKIDPLSPVQDLMLRMLEHPPQQFRFVVLTRQDPPFDLPSLRARHRINEVRLQDLRFTTPEMGEFLAATADLPVSEEALTTLEHEVEGWAAGLRLLSLALKNAPNPDAFLKGLHGSLPQIQEYLLQEVMGAQPAGVRDLLLTSSILDRFCVEMLDMIGEPPHHDDHSGFTASDFVEELRKQNLFTISIDAEGKWFRYHHLFQRLLQGELQRVRGPDCAAALRLRASQWFEGANLIEEAIKYALAAEDMERAADLVARHRHAALNADQWYVLANWLSLIPNEVMQQRAELLLARAWILLNCLSQVETVPALLDLVESLLVDDPEAGPLRGELSLCRGYLLWLMGDGAQSLKHMTVALEMIPVSHVDVRSNAEIIFAVSSQMVGKKKQAIRFLDGQLGHHDSMQAARRSRLMFARVFIHITAGELPAAEVAHQRLRKFVERAGSNYTLAWTDYMQGVIHLSRCEWDAAVEYLGRAVGRRFILHTRAATDSIVCLVLAYQAVGREDEARGTLQVLQEYAASRDDPALEALVHSAEARIAILRGRPEPARRWLNAGEPPPEGYLFWWINVPSITRCMGMIAVESPGSIAQAELRLREFARANEANHNAFQLIKVLTLLAMAYEKQGKTEEALKTLNRAVTMARKGDLLFPFVELGAPMVNLLDKLTVERDFTVQIRRIVAAFGAPTDGPGEREAGAGRAPMQEPEGRRVASERKLYDLTNRELDVLELLAQRLQNKEIATRLGTSPQTVGSHLKRVYQKLGVHGRRAAVERALADGILDRHPPG
jgi:LuxR family maltose regulon positive regulatory protein